MERQEATHRSSIPCRRCREESLVCMCTHAVKHNMHTQFSSSCLLFQPPEGFLLSHIVSEHFQEYLMCSWISAVRFHMASEFSSSYSLAPAYILCTLLCDQSITIFAAHSWQMLYKAVFGKYCTTSTEHQLPSLASHTGDCCYFCVLMLSLGSSFSKMPPKLVLSCAQSNCWHLVAGPPWTVVQVAHCTRDA